jgi:hypothetical protein
MPIDNEDLVLNATDPLERARGALRIIRRLAEQADRLDDDPLSLVDGRHQHLAAAQPAYTHHAVACALVALAGDCSGLPRRSTAPAGSARSTANASRPGPGTVALGSASTTRSRTPSSWPGEGLDRHLPTGRGQRPRPDLHAGLRPLPPRRPAVRAVRGPLRAALAHRR